MANDQRISKILKRCETFGDKLELQSLSKRFEKFAAVETVEALETVFMPKIDRFSSNIDTYEH
jgi:hypothetical protein